MVQTGPTSTSAVVQTGPTRRLAENLKPLTATILNTKYQTRSTEASNGPISFAFCCCCFVFRKGQGHVYGVIFKSDFVVVDDLTVNLFSSRVPPWMCYRMQKDRFLSPSTQLLPSCLLQVYMGFSLNDL